jgi:hypothetical protein
VTDKPKLPPNFKDTVKDTAKLTNDAIDRTSRTLGDMAKRWMDGLSRDDVDKVTKQAGTDLNEFWLKVYDTAEDNVTPPPTGQGNP